MKDSFNSFKHNELDARQLAKLVAGSCPCPGGPENPDDSKKPDDPDPDNSNGGG